MMKKRALWLLTLVIICSAAVPVRAESAAAGIGTEEYATVQAAVDAAQPGDTVVLKADVTESVSVSKNITLDLAGHLFMAPDKNRALTVSGCELTVIDSAPETPHTAVPTAYSDTVKDLQGGVFCGFKGKDAAGKNMDGCVLVNDGKFTMTGGTFYGNYTVHNGAALCLNINVIGSLDGVSFLANVGETHGGALHVGGSTSTPTTEVTVKDCLFDGNVGYRGGAIKAEYIESITILGSTFLNNETYETGGGIHLDHINSARIEESVFNGNVSWGNGGGIYLHTVETVVIDKVNCDGNQTTNMNGGGLFCWGNEYGHTQSISITNSTFNGNRTVTTNGNGSGGGLVFQDSTVIFRNNQVNGNVSGHSNGGGISIWSLGRDDDTYFLIDHCEIKNNTCEKNGGGLFLKSNYECGTVIVADTVIEGNTAGVTGGGIFTNPGPELEIGNGTEILNNHTGSSGGGVAILSCDSVLKDCTISGNTADRHGGGVFIQNAAVTLDDGCVISGNDAAVNGGGVLVQLAELTMKEGSLITENHSVSAGGGVTLLKTAVLRMEDCGRIYNNTSDLAGADLAVAAGADVYAYLNEAKNFNAKFRDTGIRIDGWYADNSGARYDQATGVPEDGREFNNIMRTLVAAVGKDARTYCVRYTARKDATYGLPEGYEDPVDDTLYNLNDMVEVAETPAPFTGYAQLNGTRVKGTWTFVQWDKTDFNISQDTDITGAWLFEPAPPETGDDTPLVLMTVLLVLSLSGCAVLLREMKKFRMN